MKKSLLIIMSILGLMSCGADGPGPLPSVGSEGVQSGSYANMLVIENRLYLVSENQLITYDLTDQSKPQEIDRQDLHFGVESIYNRANNLFVGSRESMFIFRMDDQGIPKQKSETRYLDFGELTPCDPIVANDTLAIASLSSTVLLNCRAVDINELRFFDVKNIKSPILLSVLQMEEPKGMALDDNLLFVCEASNGLKIYDIQSVDEINLLYHFEGFTTYDVIATGSLAIIVGPDYLYEYDYSDLSNVVRLSAIKL